MSTQVDEATDTKTDLAQDEASLFLLDAEFDMEEELPCEFRLHSIRKDAHDEGPGLWYILTGCPNCPAQWPVKLGCDKLKQYMDGTPPEDAVCPKCFYQGKVNEFVKRVTPRKG